MNAPVRTWADVAIGERAYWFTVPMMRIASRDGDSNMIRVRYMEDCGGRDEETGECAIKAGTEGLVMPSDEALNSARSMF